MKKLTMTIILVVFVAWPAPGQQRYYVQPPLNQWPGRAQLSAASLLESMYDLFARDTTVLLYRGQSLWFRRDTIMVEIAVDSIRGRGDHRQALVTRRIYTSRDSARAVDSLSKSNWLAYTLWAYDPVWGRYQARADSGLMSNSWSMAWGDFTLRLSMEKVTGDPTAMGGAGQRAMLRLVYRENPPASWRAYADSLAAVP